MTQQVLPEGWSIEIDQTAAAGLLSLSVTGPDGCCAIFPIEVSHWPRGHAQLMALRNAMRDAPTQQVLPPGVQVKAMDGPGDNGHWLTLRIDTAGFCVRAPHGTMRSAIIDAAIKKGLPE